jgi:hypothetical protein
MKYVSIALLSIVCLGGCTTVPKTSTSDQAFSFLRSGEYAYYIDTRGSTNFYRGWVCFLADDGPVFAVSDTDLDSGENHRYVVPVTYDEQDGYRFGVIKGDIGLSPEFQQSLADLLNFLTMRKSIDQISLTPAEYEDPWGSFTQIYRFSEVYPMFNFDRIRLSDSEEAYYKLHRMGWVEFDELASLQAIGPDLGEKYPPEPAPDLGMLDGEFVKLGAVTIRLDDRWEQKEMNGNPSFWLAGRSLRESMVTLEHIDSNQLDTWGISSVGDFFRTFITPDDALPSTINVSTPSNSMEVQYESLSDSGIRNICRLRIWNLPTGWRVLNFSSFADIYKKNLNYYEAILGSVVVPEK